MTEIPMPGDYGAQPPAAPQQKGICSRICESVCVLVGICIACIVLLFFLVLLPLLFATPFFF